MTVCIHLYNLCVCVCVLMDFLSHIEHTENVVGLLTADENIKVVFFLVL